MTLEQEELENLYDDIIKPNIDKLQRELLGRVEFYISKEDSRFNPWKSFIFTQCQNCGRDIRDGLGDQFDVIRKTQILSVKII